MPRQQPANANIWAVLGSSGSGKGVWTQSQLRRLQPPRLIVWDYLDEYSAFARRLVTLRALAVAVVKAGDGSFRYRYTPRTTDRKTLQAEFEAFCAIAWAAPRTCVLVEELSAVTTPSYAPRAWAQLCNMGRHRHMHVIGVSQFPAQMDKAILGNATLIHTGHLRTARHRKTVAEELDVSPDTIRDLAQLEYLERGPDGQVRRGSVAGELGRGRGSQKITSSAASPTPPTGSAKGDAPPVES